MKHLRSLYTAIYAWAVRLHVRRYGAPADLCDYVPTPEMRGETCAKACEAVGAAEACTCLGS